MKNKRVEIKMSESLFHKIRLYAAIEKKTRNEILLEILENYFKEINPQLNKIKINALKFGP